jgi:hypothetical protein
MVQYFIGITDEKGEVLWRTWAWSKKEKDSKVKKLLDDFYYEKNLTGFGKSLAESIRRGYPKFVTVIWGYGRIEKKEKYPILVR